MEILWGHIEWACVGRDGFDMYSSIQKSGPIISSCYFTRGKGVNTSPLFQMLMHWYCLFYELRKVE